MNKKDIGIDNIIRQAIADGKFSQLKGMGKPLKLNNNPFVEEGWQVAFDILSSNGFSPPWVESRNTIENQLASAIEKVARTLAWKNKKELDSDKWSEELINSEWEKAQTEFEMQIVVLNKKIQKYNVEVPSINFQRLPVIFEIEIEKIALRSERK